MQSDNNTNAAAIHLLEALILDNPDLERLELLLAQFNIFEALNAVRVELRHSDFLAYLLNPGQNHGLGDSFVRLFLQKAVVNGTSSQIRPLDLEIWDLSQLVVQRERQGIDILLLDEENKLVVAIENKIDTGEHDDQLLRYKNYIQQQYPGWRSIYFYLTPEGSPPSHEEYIPVSYDLVARLVERLVTSRSSTLGPDVRTLLDHYAQMLRRHIVTDNEIAKLCRSIYRKHQHALDLIYEYRIDTQTNIQQILEDLIRSDQDLILEHSSKTYLEFCPTAWELPLLKQGLGWTSSGRMLLFEWVNRENRLALSLVLGPGPLETRQRLFEFASSTPPLKPSFKALGKNFNTIYQKNFLTAHTYEADDLDALEAEITKKWEHFRKHELPQLIELFSSQAWLKES